LLEADVAQKFLKTIVAHPKVAPLLDDHFTVDGTPVQAWASLKSFVPKEAPPPSDRAPPPGYRRCARPGAASRNHSRHRAESREHRDA
jgi:hypothetical protein